MVDKDEEIKLHTINKDIKSVVDSPLTYLYYGKNGHLVMENNPLQVAKKCIDMATKNEKYFIKSKPKGMEKGRFFDPSRDFDIDLKSFEWVKIDAESFEMYITYLERKSNNSKLLKAAERVAYNG